MAFTIDAKQLGDHIAFVLPAYLFTFAVWTAASSYDYISGKWQTVRMARRRGMRHLGILVLPMAYMIAYIKFQSDADDAKELSAGVIALLFAGVEFLRTVVGLWQLHVFRHWTADSVQSLQSLGYVAKKNKEDDGAGIATGGGADGKSTHDESSSQNGRNAPIFERKSALEIADGLIVNDLIVDNRLSDGEIQCILRNRHIGASLSRGQRLRSCWRWLSCVWYFPCLVVAICRSRKPSYTSPSSGIYLKPYNAEDVFMRWACVLVAQAFPMWLDDMQKSGMSDMSPENGGSPQLARFKRGLLCAAALHTQSRVDDAGPGGFGHFELKEWHKYPKLCSGVFSLQEFLRVACATGKGLPFGEPHTRARAGGDDSEYSYVKFKSKLHRIREMFQVDDVDKLKGFETHHLEWLAVFISVPDWRARTGNKDVIDAETTSQSSAPFNCTGLATSNLRAQLGISISTSESRLFLSRSLTRFPLFGNNLRRTLWGNRNVSETSLHIDNILALSAGDQFGFMTKMKTSTFARITNALSVSGIENVRDLYSSSDATFTLAPDTSRAEQVIVSAVTEGNEDISTLTVSARERDRLLYQLVTESPENGLFEQSATFLGCGMECLRSSLAVWMRNNPDAPDCVWSPSLEETNAEPRRSFSFRASESLVRCLGKTGWVRLFEQRHMQLRLLWELQTHFRGMIPASGLSPETGQAIILCLISFPAIFFSAVEDSASSELSSEITSDGVQIAIQAEEKEDCKMLLSVPFRPQEVAVEIRLELLSGEDVKITAVLRGNGIFSWQVWRDDFTTRLEDMSRWQSTNELESLPVIRTNDNIYVGLRSAKLTAFGTGTQMRTWSGWLPHRPSICKFELESDGLILPQKKQPLRLKFLQDVEATQATGLMKAQNVPVSYALAAETDLEHVTSVAQRVIVALKNCRDEVHGLTLHGGKILLEETRQSSAVIDDREKEFRLRLSESVSVHHQSFDALERTITSLCAANKTLAVFTRAAGMVESFCALLGEAKPTFDVGAPGLKMKDEEAMQRVLSLVEKLASERDVGHAMARSFARLCTSFENCDKLEMMQHAASLLLKKIVSAPHRLSDKVYCMLCRDLGSILGRVGAEDTTVSLLMHMRYSEKRDNWRWNGNDALTGSDSPASPKLAAIQFSIGAVETNDAVCITTLAEMYHHGYQNNTAQPSRAAKLYTRAIEQSQNVTAMNSLAFLLRHGADGVAADPARAVGLYTRAVNEGGNVAAMYNLGNLLAVGAEGVDPDPARAVDLYTRAIDEGDYVNAACNLGLLLTSGANGVDADPARAVDLCTRAVDEGDCIPAMFNLGNLLKNGTDGVEADPVRAVDLLSRAVEEGAHVGAMRNLADMLRDGADGVDVDIARSVSLYSSAVVFGAGRRQEDAILGLLGIGVDVQSEYKYSG